MDAGRHDDGRQHVRQRAQGARRRAVRRAVSTACHHQGVSRLGLGFRVHLGQLVASRARRPELVRRAERRTIRSVPGHPAARDPGQRKHAGLRHRRAPHRWRATTSRRHVRLGDLHQSARHIRRVEPARARQPAGGRDSLCGPDPGAPGRTGAARRASVAGTRAGVRGRASGDPVSIVAAIESLAGLHERGILTDEEFAAKKTELLGRL